MRTKLPDGWRMMKFMDISEDISAGGTPSRDKKEYWENGTIPWLKIADMKSLYIKKTEEKITKLGLDNSSAKLFPKGTLVYSIFASLGAIGILDIDATTNQAIAGINPKREITNTKYLYYCLHSERDKILSKKSHATQDNLNLTILRNHEIPVPPLPTQQKIVSILEKAEQTKDMRKEADELTKDFLKSIFMEMFGDKKKFETKKLSEICTVESGGTPSRIEKDYWEGGTIPWLGSTVCKDCRVNESEQFITENGLKNSSARMFKKGTILVALVGATIGKTAYLNFEASTNQNIAGIYPKQNITLNSEYLFYAVQLLYPKFIALSSDTFKMANLSFVRGLEIPSPPIELQNKFASIVKEVEAMKEQQKYLKEHLDKLFNALMQKAFKGELA